MSNPNNSSNTTTSTTPKPFDWLHGGLFFGGGNNNNNNNNNTNNQKDDGIDRIDSEKDVNVLLDGINDNLQATLVLTVNTEVTTTTTTAAAAAAAAATTTTTTTEADNPSSSTSTTTSPSDFLAARLARLRFLLYDERRITSSSSSSSSSQPHYHSNDSNTNPFSLGRVTIPSVALSTVQGLAGAHHHATLIPQLIRHLAVLPFESRKHVAAIFNYLLVCGLDGTDRELYIPIMNAFRDYVGIHFDDILQPILQGYRNSHDGSTLTDVVLHCGSMYRSCFRHVTLYRELVTTTDRVRRYVFPFLETYATLPNFDVSSDAMENVKAVMTAGCDGSDNESDDDAATQQELSELSAAFLTRDYEAVWDERFNPNLLSPDTNYMTKRVALQILSTVLLTRSNYAVMIRYVNSRTNLIVVMKLLRDTSPHITLDAFHVFKVFVANPNKLPEVEKILKDNSQKLCLYLETLHQDKEPNDPQFAEEKKLIIATIRNL
ncbi:Mo25-like protein [Nitzschia inconspicua]|uniref:Mo25-like protein n=1 Tax=Nitzschia inconspicua TaxID=303405 RepID=A0A9K3LXC9_9STRA|nr:Mo25-like protein [Nitzschia inconspicua]